MRRRYLLTLPMILVMVSCVQMPMLKASNPGTIKIIAPETDRVSENDLAISLEYMGLDHDNWKFKVRVKNQLDSSVMIQPGNLVCQLDQTSSEQQTSLVHALTTDGEMARIQRERAILKHAYARRNQAQLIGATIDLVGALIPDSETMTKEEKNTERIEDLEREVSDLKFNENYKRRLAELDEEAGFWQSQLLKATELAPGETTEGLVYFPVQDYQGSLHIFIHFYPYRYVQTFEQRLVYVNL